MVGSALAAPSMLQESIFRWVRIKKTPLLYVCAYGHCFGDLSLKNKLFEYKNIQKPSICLQPGTPKFNTQRACLVECLPGRTCVKQWS
jgi:hypothetical protein